uniref:Uncharacterized protein n=1 Tax=Anguilla anguilla TaxID=7936 RepID=A0A0E9WN97_ANGAN
MSNSQLMFWNCYSGTLQDWLRSR